MYSSEIISYYSEDIELMLNFYCLGKFNSFDLKKNTQLFEFWILPLTITIKFILNATKVYSEVELYISAELGGYF